MRFIAIAWIVFISSCSDDKDQKIYQALDNGFSSSYQLINRQSQFILGSLESKTYNPASATIAANWYNKASAIKKRSDNLKDYVGNLKRNLQDKNNLSELYDSLDSYKNFILNMDPIIKQEFESRIYLFDSILKEAKLINSNISAPLLGYFQNNIAMVENMLINFCNDQTTLHRLNHEHYLPIVTQNIKYAKPGDEIEITAGIGAFKYMFDQKVTIGGINIELDEWSIAKHKIKVNNQIGTHTYPVQIEYKDQDGKLQLINKTVEFTVTK